jgi:hypothetical protein
MKNIKTIARIAPNSLMDWLKCRSQLDALRTLLHRLRLGSRHSHHLNHTMTKVIHKIATHEEAERQALNTINIIEQQHKKAHQERKLRKIMHCKIKTQQEPENKQENYLSAFVVLAFWRRKFNRF